MATSVLRAREQVSRNLPRPSDLARHALGLYYSRVYFRSRRRFRRTSVRSHVDHDVGLPQLCLTP